MFFDSSELKIIHLSHQENSIWKFDKLDTIKSKIKSHLHTKQTTCCYCYRSFKDEFNMVIDIEHILPSSIFRENTFDLKNLSLACKRCNMRIKKDRIDFLTGNLLKIANYLESKPNLERYINKCDRIRKDISKFDQILYNSKNYLFIHPLLDTSTDHIRYFNLQIDSKSIVMYVPKSHKGEFSINFFELHKFKTQELNIIQSLNDPDNISIFNIPNLI